MWLWDNVNVTTLDIKKTKTKTKIQVRVFGGESQERKLKGTQNFILLFGVSKDTV